MVDGLILVVIPKFDMAQIKINATSKSKNIKIKYPRNQYLSSLGISLESTPIERKQTYESKRRVDRNQYQTIEKILAEILLI